VASRTSDVAQLEAERVDPEQQSEVRMSRWSRIQRTLSAIAERNDAPASRGGRPPGTARNRAAEARNVTVFSANCSADPREISMLPNGGPTNCCPVERDRCR